MVEVLSAFVREHSDSVHTDSEPSVAKVLITFLQDDREPAGERQSDVKQPRSKPNPSTDVRAALAVLGGCLPSRMGLGRTYRMLVLLMPISV